MDSAMINENENVNLPNFQSRLSEVDIDRRNQSVNATDRAFLKQSDSNRLLENQMAYSLIVTVTDNGDPPLKSSTILRILFTPPFYPPSNSKESLNSLTIKHFVRQKLSNNQLDYTKNQPKTNEFDLDGLMENELTGVGVLLGLVTAIGLFVCFLILVIMITFYQSRRFNEHRKQLLERRQAFNQQQLEHTQLQQHQQLPHRQQSQEHIQPLNAAFNTQSSHFLPHSILHPIPVEQNNKSDKTSTNSSRQYYLQGMSEVMPNSQSELVTNFTTL
ncbi:Protocadherin-9 [Schistosoma japonicum]|nr:Protocadherin-9 [Schistosoma japonicum]